MEFADLIHEHLKENGIQSHIQPWWRTPPTWERQAYADIDFGPEAYVRAIRIAHNLQKTLLIVFYHPVTEQVYIKYWKAHRLTKGEKKRLKRGNHRLGIHRSQQINWQQAWKVFPLADPDALPTMVDFIEYVLKTYKFAGL